MVALSTTEAEYIAAGSGATQAVWLRRMLSELKHQHDASTVIYWDYKSTISLTKNPVYHGKSKHIDIKFHFIRDLVKDKEIVIEYCRSEEQVADIFMKPLKVDNFQKLKKSLGMMSYEELGLRGAT